MSEALKKGMEATFRDASVDTPGKDRVTVSVPSGSVPTVLHYLREKGFDHLTMVSCVDRPDDDELELVYVLSSYTNDPRLHVTVKARIPREGGGVGTVKGVFPNAEPYEREIHELFGADFPGHGRLIPLFLEREYDIPPFRKDFDSRKYVEETFDSIPAVEGD
jgi:NADH-quinone oxidoreductase subunit C